MSHEPLYQEEDPLGTRKPAAPTRRRVELYNEEVFAGANMKRSVHVGWGAVLGAGFIFWCMGMSAVTQSSSWNVSFRWLQRRVGAQFGTLTYLITTNALFYHDGDRWVTRDWADVAGRFTGSAAARGLPDITTSQAAIGKTLSQGFAADAARG